MMFAFTGMNSRNIAGLLMLATVFSFGGSFISLAMSKWLAKRSTGAMVFESPCNELERWLVDTVAIQAKYVEVDCPEVAIFNAQISMHLQPV